MLSGRWDRRRLDGFSTVELTGGRHELHAAAALLNDALGSGFVADDDLARLAESPDGVVLVARGPDHQLLGVGTAAVLTESEQARLDDELTAAGVRRPNPTRSRVGLLKSVAVRPAARGRGIGLALVHQRLARLTRLGCATATVLAWDSGTRHSSLTVLDAAGFRRVAELPEYWREPEGHETFDCIRCGRPCTCTAVVLRRSL